MGRDLNRFEFIGRLGRDPDIRFTPSGTAVATLNVAVGDDYYDSDKEEWVNRTNWFRVTQWGKAAENSASRLEKGSMVFVEGKMENDSYEKEGVTVNTYRFTAYRIQVLAKDNSSPVRKGEVSDNEDVGFYDDDDDDDDVPF